ncbi:hypothetical protein [Mesorhizobium sp. NZP2077]|uniref:hypothetical protein n=1 Tax=Mesorhizobium sp. NZP2077 TaxID=2483404 RepID=UPI001556BE4F|nr:hypothetical protein [Mesorhizobium sp. NZP2077]
MTFGVGKREGFKIELAGGFPAIVYHPHEPLPARLNHLNLCCDIASVLGVIHRYPPMAGESGIIPPTAGPSFKFDEFSLYESYQAVFFAEVS